MQVQEAIRLQNAQGYGCPIRRNKHRIALDLVFKVQTSYVVLRWALLLRRPEHFLGLLNTFSASWTSRGKVDFCTKRACISLARLTVMPQTSSVATWLFAKQKSCTTTAKRHEIVFFRTDGCALEAQQWCFLCSKTTRRKVITAFWLARTLIHKQEIENKRFHTQESSTYSCNRIQLLLLPTPNKNESVIFSQTKKKRSWWN